MMQALNSFALLPLCQCCFFFMKLRPLRSTLFPYTTLFRSRKYYVVPAMLTVAADLVAPLPSRPPTPICATVDRKSTRLNSSHGYISYAVFCLKKKIQVLIPSASNWLDIIPVLPKDNFPTLS